MERVVLDEHKIDDQTYRRTCIKGEEKKVTTVCRYENGKYMTRWPDTDWCENKNLDGLYKYEGLDVFYMSTFKNNERNGLIIQFQQ